MVFSGSYYYVISEIKMNNVNVIEIVHVLVPLDPAQCVRSNFLTPRDVDEIFLS